MDQLLHLLLRILFPFDKVGRSRELMRGWLRMMLGWMMDPITVADFEDYPEDRLWLEGHIAATEYGLQVLVWERAREMLGLPFLYHRRQLNPVFRRPKEMRRLYRRLSQLSRNFHNLDKLAARLAARMRRERDADPLGLAPAHDALAANAASAICSDLKTQARTLCPPSRAARGRWIATSSSRDGGGCASSRGPPLTALDCRLPTADCLAPHLRDRPLTPKTKNPGDRSPGFFVSVLLRPSSRSRSSGRRRRP